MGLEDLEGCERAFSKSNALAALLWYASVFHWMQAIATYFEHNYKCHEASNILSLQLHFFLTIISKPAKF